MRQIVLSFHEDEDRVQVTVKWNEGQGSQKENKLADEAKVLIDDAMRHGIKSFMLTNAAAGPTEEEAEAKLVLNRDIMKDIEKAGE